MALTVGTGRRKRRILVEVYTRQDCSLCAEAEARVASEARRVRVRRIDIDEDEALRARYNDRVPVIVVDGREVVEGHVGPGVIRQAIRRASEGRWAEWRRA